MYAVRPIALLMSICLFVGTGEVSESNVLTWADDHAELAAIFAKPPTRWPCDVIRTNLKGFHQPTVVLASNEELIVNGNRQLVHSTDGGQSWRVLCPVPLNSSVPDGYTLLSCHILGVGMTSKGTIVVSYSKQYNDGRRYDGYADETYHLETYMLRSADRGRTWDRPVRLDPAPYKCVGANKTRLNTLPDGRIVQALMVHDQPRPGETLPKSKWFSQAFLYGSADEGHTWKNLGSLGRFTDESDLLVLPSGRGLATTRYQRKKLPGDPARLATPYYFDPEHKRHSCADCALGATAVGGHSVYKHTALLVSDDGGRTWSRPRLVTGWLQQTACLARLSNGTLVLPFGHKDKGQGQRFLVSYDDGRSWSRTVYELHVGGLYASTVALKDDTLVTVYYRNGRLEVLRWRAPDQRSVAKGGFFRPQPIKGGMQ